MNKEINSFTTTSVCMYVKKLQGKERWQENIREKLLMYNSNLKDIKYFHQIK